MALTKDEILNLDDIKIREIQIPEWAGSVFIRQLTRGQADEYFSRRFEKSEIQQRGRGNNVVESQINMFGHDAWLVAQAVCDEAGKRLFTNGDVDNLKNRNANAIGRIAVEIIKFSQMQEDVEELDKLKN